MSKYALAVLAGTPFLLALAGCDEARIARERAAGVITEAEYRQHLQVLASDEFEGRAPGSAGEKRAVEYLEQQFLDLGLQPAADGSFRQYVPLVEITAAVSDSRLGFAGPAGRLDLALGEEMVVGTRRLQL